MIKAIVVAGDLFEYRNWLLDNGLNEKEYKFVQDSRKMQGIDRGTIVYKIGTYRRLKDIENMERLIQYRFKEREWERT